MTGIFLKTALRNVSKNRVFTLINITGLSLGICSALIIYILVSYHFSFDTFHRNNDRIYRVITEFHQESIEYERAVPQPLGKAFRNDFTLAEKTARIVSLSNSQIAVTAGNETNRFEEKEGVAYTEPQFFEIFNFPLLKGNQKTVLTEPNTALITEKIARKYFGTEDPLGKMIKVDNRDDFTIAGILKDLPPNTGRKNEIFLSYHNLRSWNSWLASDSSWTGVYKGMECFILLRKGVSADAVNRALVRISEKYYDKEDAKVFRFALQPLKDIHLNTGIDADISRETLYTLSVIGLFLLIVACVNFINLATAQSLKRAKEVGVRKVLGCSRKQIFWQFISETSVTVLLAWILALVAAIASIPSLNQLLGTTMGFSFDVRLIFFLLTTFVFVVFLSGFYPGLIQSAWLPLETLKGTLKKTGGTYAVRKALVIFQFAIVQMLIIGVIVIAAQMHYATNTDLGFSKDGIVLLDVPKSDKASMSTLQSRLSGLNGVKSVSFSSASPASSSNSLTGFKYDNRTEAEPYDVNLKQIDTRYLATYGLKLVAGRNLFPSDTVREFLVNETLLKKLKLRSPEDILGKRLLVNGDRWTGPVVGVVKDFYNQSMHTGIEPVCMTTDSERYSKCAVKLDVRNLKSLLPQMKTAWESTYPDNIYSYDFFDDSIRRLYEREQTMLSLIELFAVIAIVIGCMGLYGLVSFMALQRTKEIGVRKVLGASEGSILWLFGKEFSLLVVFSFLIAAPVAAAVMNAWLRNFAYHIPLSWLIFLVSIVTTTLVTSLTVGYRSIRAARVNPVKSLRME